MTIQAYLDKQCKKIDRALSAYLPKRSDYSRPLIQAMRYAVFPGGKRIRPSLVLAACEAVGGDEKKVMPAACALELIHSYSLVHDDLPCMDDDRWRRGLPTCHVKFGQDIAVLAGDALLTLAFQILNQGGDAVSGVEAKRRLQAGAWVAEAVGCAGMVGGQALDIQFQNKIPGVATLKRIHMGKSAALIAVSARVGAYLGGAGAKDVQHLTRYGQAIGLLFQLVDDIMDQEGYAKAMGVPQTNRLARQLLQKAKTELAVFGQSAKQLNALADFVLTRKS